jgi:solute carrier family 25 (adenine nucleotide translocator) protein 4/5/6/31
MHHRGFRGIFNGVLINLVYMSLARGVYFGFYDSYKRSIKSEPGKILLSYGSLCFALLACFPLDTIRKRVIISKNRHRNARECVRHIWKEERLLGLYHGWQVVGLQASSFCILYYLYDIMFTEIFRSNGQ